MTYYLYIDGVLMPVTPSKVTTKIKNKNSTMDLAAGGELNFVKSPGLTEISFDLLLPSVRYSWALYEDDEFKSPNYYLELFETLKKERKSFDLIILRISAQTLLQAAAGLISLPGLVDAAGYDYDQDGKITAADARILLRSPTEVAVLSDTNVTCTIEDYTVTEDVTKYGRDFNVSLKLKQYVAYGLKKATYSVSG